MNHNKIREEILRILSDNRWHKLSEFLHIGREHIPPENAFRIYNQMFKKDQLRPEIEIDQKIAKGRQRRIERTLLSMSKNPSHNLKIEGRGFNKRYCKVS